MQKVVNYQPKFDALKNMKQAVMREIRRKKALGQYIVVAHKGKVEKIDFSFIKK